MARTLLKAKRHLSEKYGLDVIEEADLGKTGRGDIIKGEVRPPTTIAIRVDLDYHMKLIAIAHEAGHLINLRQCQKGYLHGSEIAIETVAWLNGLPIAIGMGILKEYTNYWRTHLSKTIKHSNENT